MKLGYTPDEKCINTRDLKLWINILAVCMFGNVLQAAHDTQKQIRHNQREGELNTRVNVC